MLEVLDEGNEGEELQNPEGALQGEGNCQGAGNGQGSGCGRPHHVRGDGGMDGAGGVHRCSSIREYDLEPSQTT